MRSSCAPDKILPVAALLRKRFGRIRFAKRRDPVGELVKTILSQNTSDSNSFRAYDNLKKRFKSWDDLRRAGLSPIKREIKTGGLANIKAVRIKGALNEILRRRGSLNIDFIDGMDTRAGYDFLRSIKGVGPKTAAIVLLFCFGKPVMPVDTHIYRVCGRLGLIGNKITREKAQECLTVSTPKALIAEFHLNLISHGRKICIAGNPRCRICNLKRLCKYYGEKYGRQNVKNRKKRI